MQDYKDMITKSTELLGMLAGVFPPLVSTLRKGDNGRIAVIGGSLQFTGAPFYAAISSLKTGGDLAHIFCSKSASPSIKAYSPEIIVHPVFVSEAEVKLSAEQLKAAHGEWLGRILAWSNAINAWVIGPGLGRDRYMREFFPILIRNLPEGALVVLDADGIFFLSKHPGLMGDLKRFRTILTPNAREMTFIKDILPFSVEGILEKNSSSEELQQIEGVKGCEGITLFMKGSEDLILSSQKSFIIRTEGGKKRCGGLGDILSGAIAVCASWDFTYGLVLASRIVRIATRKAFEKQGRGTTAPIVIDELTQVVKSIQSSSL